MGTFKSKFQSALLGFTVSDGTTINVGLETAYEDDSSPIIEPTHDCRLTTECQESFGLDFTCHAGRCCPLGCATDRDCSFQFTELLACKSGLCVKNDMDINTKCSSNADCSSIEGTRNLFCQDGMCIDVTCDLDKNCEEEGFKCVNGMCKQLQVEP